MRKSIFFSLAVAQVGMLAANPKESPLSLELAGEIIQIGMKKSAVLSRLRALEITTSTGSSVPEANSWFVSRKNGAIYESVGNIGFDTQGRVNKVYKYWNARDNSSFSLSCVLFDTVQVFNERYGVNGYSIQTSSNVSNGATIRNILISHGKRTVKITSFEGLYIEGEKRSPSVSVHEEIY